MPIDYPILEFDDSRAIIDPHPRDQDVIPKQAVLCFFFDVLRDLKEKGVLTQVSQRNSEMGPNPIYKLIHNGEEVTVMHPGVGAPLAGAFMDELIATGVKAIIACGGCGVLNHDIAAGSVMVVESAVRDEGTSYHYLPPSREVEPSPLAVEAIESVCRTKNLPYTLVKTWTTDGIYRETTGRRDKRLAEGCTVVEMEASAMFAVAKLRNVHCGQLLYGGDVVVPEGWDKRQWDERLSDRENLFWLAVESCLELAKLISE